MNKTLLTVFSCFLLLVSCQKSKEVTTEIIDEPTAEMQGFGENFEAKDVKSKEEMAKLYATLAEGDTLQLQFKSEIQSTCKKKGCWMSLDLGNNEKAIVRFKDYGFFVPKEGAEGKESIVNGKAFLAVTSIEQLKHDAKDGGKSQAAIDSIVVPKVVKMFLADGVLIQQ